MATYVEQNQSLQGAVDQILQIRDYRKGSNQALSGSTSNHVHHSFVSDFHKEEKPMARRISNVNIWNYNDVQHDQLHLGSKNEWHQQQEGKEEVQVIHDRNDDIYHMKFVCYKSKTIPVSLNSNDFSMYMENGATDGPCFNNLDGNGFMSTTTVATQDSNLTSNLNHNIKMLDTLKIEYHGCVATSGTCIDTFDKLQRTVTNTLQDGDTISFCDGKIITSFSTITIRRNNIVFCCESNRFQCTIVSSPTSNITTIVALGSNFTIRGMIMSSEKNNTTKSSHSDYRQS